MRSTLETAPALLTRSLFGMGAILRLAMLALMLGAGARGAAAGPIKASHFRAVPDSFALDTVTFRCDLENTKRYSLPADSTSSGLRYRFHVAAGAECWDSEWIHMPGFQAHQTLAVSALVALASDSTSDERAPSLNASIQIDDGHRVRTVSKRSYYRWRTGRFHEAPENSRHLARRMGPEAVSGGAAYATHGDDAPATELLTTMTVSWGMLKVLYTQPGALAPWTPPTSAPAAAPPAPAARHPHGSEPQGGVPMARHGIRER